MLTPGKWITTVRGTTWIAVLLLCLGTFLRLVNINQTAQFLGDQGRDALVISRIFLERDLVFIGPVTSVGNMYLGPLYYYAMAPFLWLSYPSPMGPVYAVVGLSVLALLLVYVFGKRVFGEKVALVALTLMVFSAPLVEYSRFSWNPNPVPLIMVLLLYTTYLAWKKNSKYWILVFVLLGVSIQLHYLTLVLFGGAGVIWLLALIDAKKQKGLIKQSLATGGGLLALVTLLSPLILFDSKHQGLNARAFVTLFTTERSFSHDGSFVSVLGAYFTDFFAQLSRVFFDLSWGISLERGALVAVFAMVAILGFVYFKLSSARRPAMLVVLSYGLLGVIGISVYNHQIFTHYILFFIPITAYLFGLVLAQVWKMGKIAQVVVLLALGWYAYTQVQRMPLVGTTMTMAEYRAASDEIVDHIKQGEKYAVVLLAPTGDLYGQNYRYFLSTHRDKQPVDSEKTIEVDTLVIINEERLADPLELPIYQLEIFPNKTIDKRITLSSGMDVYILRKEPTVK